MTEYIRKQMVKRLDEENKNWNSVCNALGHGCNSVVCMSKPAIRLCEEYSIDSFSAFFSDYFIAQDWANNIFNERCKYSEVVVIYFNGDLYKIKDEENKK